jgi:hypothetical protein
VLKGTGRNGPRHKEGPPVMALADGTCQTCRGPIILWPARAGSAVDAFWTHCLAKDDTHRARPLGEYSSGAVRSQSARSAPPGGVPPQKGR